MRTKFTIAYADDDLDDQELVRESIKHCKVPVELVVTYNGLMMIDFLLKRQAYRHLSGLPDLILLDLNMPLMDGFEVLKEIKKYPHLRDIPIYVLSTSTTKPTRDLALSLGAHGFYSKGNSASDLYKIMKKICDDCFSNELAH